MITKTDILQVIQLLEQSLERYDDNCHASGNHSLMSNDEAALTQNMIDRLQQEIEKDITQ